MNRRLKMVILFVSLALAWIVVRYLVSLSQPAHRLGVQGGRLAACPDRPNCVSSQADRPEQQIDPLPLRVPVDRALSQLKSAIRSIPRSRIVVAKDQYLHAEFQSAWLGFVDDVEVYVDDSEQLIHFRSASRLGYSDLGVNRRRLERLRGALEAR